MDQLSDEQLCALNGIVYNKQVRDGLAEACATASAPTLREVVDAVGETYYDAMEWEMSMDRNDWYGLVNAVDAPGALGDLRVVDVGAMDADAVGFVGADGTPYAVFCGTSANDHGNDVDWFSGSESQLAAEGRAYISYLRSIAGGAEVVACGHAEGGGRALAATVTGAGVSRCVTFDARGLSATFSQLWSAEATAAAAFTRNYHTSGDVTAPNVAELVGTNVAIVPTHTDAGSIKRHALISLLDGGLAFGARDTAHRGEGIALDALAALVADLEDRPGSAGAGAALAETFSDFVAWLDTAATDDEKKKLNPFINELIDAAESGKPRRLSEVFTRNTATAGLFLYLLAQFPGIREDAELGIVAFLVASKATDGESDRIAETLLSMLHVSKRARSSIKSTFTRHVRNGFEEGRETTAAQMLQANATHDFGDERLNELLGIIAEIEAEPFYDVTRWDVWYHIEQGLGLLTMERYQHDIRTYQRKVLDLTNTTAGDIRQRFTQARELDAGFARQMRTADQALEELGSRLDAFETRL